MDRVAIRERFVKAFQKYKYVILILCLGLVLMSLPETPEETEEFAPTVSAANEMGTAEALEEILSQIEGVGKVSVLLTESTGAETIYQTNQDSSVSSDSESLQVETVIISNDNGENGLVRKVNPPTYLGAVVVCQGADRPSIQLAVVEAVANATGISADHITVLKMK